MFNVEDNTNNKNSGNTIEKYMHKSVVNIFNINLYLKETSTPGELEFGGKRRDLNNFQTRHKYFFAGLRPEDRDRDDQMPSTSDHITPGPQPFHHKNFKKKST